MDRRPLLLLAAAMTAAAAPAIAVAQSWPAGALVVASASTIRPPSPTFARIEAPESWRAPAELPPTQPVDHPPPLKLQPRIAQVERVPAVELRPKDAWLDDQGFRASPTRLSYKARF